MLAASKDSAEPIAVAVSVASAMSLGGAGVRVSPSTTEWDEAYGAELSSSQQESDEMAEACDLMSETPPTSPRSTNEPHWWMESLSAALTSLGRTWPPIPQRAVQVVTGCAGCSAEAAVFKVAPHPRNMSLPCC